jgi:hypothetical protein
VAKLIAAGVVLGAALFAGAYGLERALAGFANFRDETALAILLVSGAFLYGLLVLALLGQKWLRSLFREVSVAAEQPASADLPPPDPTDDSADLPDNEPPPKA